jgi:predicted RNase H-like HicB family nuclease
MLTYKASFTYLDDGIHGEILDFPAVNSRGETLDETRDLLANALVEVAETNLLRGQALPTPDPDLTDPEADVEEPMHLMLMAMTCVNPISSDAG